MALKRPQQLLDSFSMASMTDVVFLLLVFFMVTSAFVFPTALEVDLPQSQEQTPLKPAYRVFIDAEGNYYRSSADEQPLALPADSIDIWVASLAADSVATVAVYADSEVEYGKVVEILNIGARNSVKMVLATRPTSPSEVPAPAAN